MENLFQVINVSAVKAVYTYTCDVVMSGRLQKFIKIFLYVQNIEEKASSKKEKIKMEI